MTIQDYQIQAKRTLALLPGDLNRQHMILGIISEIGELADAYKKHIAYGKELDDVNLREEIGDLCFYAANYANIESKQLKEPSIINIDYDEHGNISYEAADLILEAIWQLDFSNPQKIFNLVYSLNEFLCLGDLSDILQNNIDKLKVRYPEKFTEENALNRDLESERKELSK